MVYFLLQFASNGSIFFFIHPTQGLPEYLALRFFYQTAQAIHYLHSKNIAHRDIKPENILLDENFQVKLCDFGWACKMEPGEVRTSLCGTFEYMSPEIVLNGVHTNKSDVWALGILLFELLHGKTPVKTRKMSELKSFYQNEKIEIKKSVSQEVRDLLQKMLVFDDVERINIDKLMNIEFLKQIKLQSERPISSSAISLLMKNYLVNTQKRRNRNMPSVFGDLTSQEIDELYKSVNMQLLENKEKKKHEQKNKSLQKNLPQIKQQDILVKQLKLVPKKRRIALDQYQSYQYCGELNIIEEDQMEESLQIEDLLPQNSENPTQKNDENWKVTSDFSLMEKTQKLQKETYFDSRTTNNADFSLLKIGKSNQESVTTSFSNSKFSLFSESLQTVKADFPSIVQNQKETTKEEIHKEPFFQSVCESFDFPKIIQGQSKNYNLNQDNQLRLGESLVNFGNNYNNLYKSFEVKKSKKIVFKLDQRTGAQGSVYKFSDNDVKNKNKVVKSVFLKKNPDEQSQSNFKDLEKEISILQIASSLDVKEEVVGFFGFCKIENAAKTDYYVVIEKCEKEFMDFMSQIKNSKKVTYDIVLKILYQMLTIVLDINGNGIYHIDNHINNFMICQNKLKLIDFGKGKLFRTEKDQKSILKQRFERFEIINLKQSLTFVNGFFNNENQLIGEIVNNFGSGKNATGEKISPIEELKNAIEQIKLIRKKIDTKQMIEQKFNKKAEAFVAEKFAIQINYQQKYFFCQIF